MCVEQGIALGAHREQNFYSILRRKNSDTKRIMERGNFLEVINAFAILDAVLMEHLEKSAKNSQMVSW